MDERFLYFAYGSNLLTRRLQERTPSGRAQAVGHVVGRRLRFSKRSDDGSGKADAELMSDAADQVEGVMFSIDTAQKQALDEAEGVGRGYEESYVEVITAKPRGPEGVFSSVRLDQLVAVLTDIRERAAA